MNHPSLTSRILLVLIAAAIVLLVVLSVVLSVAVLLGAMGDQFGSRALKGVGLGCGIFLTVDLILLVLVQAIHTLLGNGPPPEQP